MSTIDHDHEVAESGAAGGDNASVAAAKVVRINTVVIAGTTLACTALTRAPGCGVVST
jgi:hypothetical protein